MGRSARTRPPWATAELEAEKKLGCRQCRSLLLLLTWRVTLYRLFLYARYAALLLWHLQAASSAAYA